MHTIIPKQLWLGNAADARDLPAIHRAGISAVIDLALEEPPAQLTRDLIHCRIPLTDGADNSAVRLRLAIEVTTRHIREQIPTLVACSAGMSRSPAIVAAALAVVRGQKPDDCLQEISANRPHDVSPLLWRDVKTIYDQSYS